MLVSEPMFTPPNSGGAHSTGSLSLDRLIRAVLVSGPVKSLKGAVRDHIWTVRARRLRNPPWPVPVKSVLFICYGNICRSPFAALLADKRLRQAGISGVRCASAGFRISQRASSPPEAVTAAALYGITLQDHQPALLTPELVGAFDVVFVMEPWQLDALQRRWPAQRHRLFLLPLFEPERTTRGAFERCHLIDPFGKGAAEFDHCYARIDAALSHIVCSWSSAPR